MNLPRSLGSFAILHTRTMGVDAKAGDSIDAHKPYASFILGILIIATSSASAFATPSYFRANINVLDRDVRYTVQADGSYIVEESTSFVINTEQAIQQYSQSAHSYSSSLEELTIVSAYVADKTGKRVDVLPNQIMDQQSAQSANAPMFDDIKVKTVVFPGVEVGSTLHEHVRRERRRPLFSGQFSMIEWVSPYNDHAQVKIVVDAPKEMRLHAETIGLKQEDVVTASAGRQRLQWTLIGGVGWPAEANSVSPIDTAPRVAVSTFADQEAAGIAYNARAKPRAAVTPDIQALADQITIGIQERREQAEALYRWVSRNVRYVAVFLEYGGVVPHDADAVAKVKYGDCKDHVVLLEALLAAKGIRSSPVLVNSGATYWLPKVAVVPGIFDHAISYLPEFDLFVDSTAQAAMFGTLPIGEQGKSALITDAGNGLGRVTILPVSRPAIDRIVVTSTLALRSDGSIDGDSQIRSDGTFDWLSRTIFLAVVPQEAELAGRLLSMTGQSGSGDYKHGNMLDLSHSFWYSTKFKLPTAVQLPGPGAMTVPAGLGSITGIARAFDNFSSEERSLPMPYAGRSVEETTAILLPPGITVTAIPKDVAVKSDLGSYDATYTMKDRTIVVQRRLTVSPDGPLVKPDAYLTLRTLGLAVNRDLRSQIVYQ